MKPISDIAKGMQAFIDNLLQQTISQEEIDAIRRKLRLITPLNKRICGGLYFSKAARVTNAIFPDEALKWAANNVKRYLEGDERYECFYKLCHAYCLEHDITIDPDLKDKLYSLFKVSPLDPKTTITRIHAPVHRIKRRPNHYVPSPYAKATEDRPEAQRRSTNRLATQAPKKPPSTFQPSKSFSKKGMVYDKKTSNVSERVLTPDEIHMLKYGIRDKKKEVQSSWTQGQQNASLRLK